MDDSGLQYLPKLLDTLFRHQEATKSKEEGKIDGKIEDLEEGEALLSALSVGLMDKIRGGPTTLFAAAKSGSSEEVALLLKAKADVNARNSSGQTALMVNAMQGDVSITKLLLKGGADVDARDKNQNTALMWSAKEGYASVATELLGHGANVNAMFKDSNGSERTALIWSALKGHASVTKVLLENGADLDIKDENGKTALSIAEFYGKTNVVKVLTGWSGGQAARYVAQHQDEDGKVQLSGEPNAMPSPLKAGGKEKPAAAQGELVEGEYNCEYAKSNRSKCKHCEEQIDKDEARVGPNERMDRPPFIVSTKWHHLKCMWKNPDQCVSPPHTFLRMNT